MINTLLHCSRNVLLSINIIFPLILYFMKINFNFLFSFVFALVLLSCDDEHKTASVPYFDKILLQEKIYTGQYASAKVTYKSPGAYVQHADYTYSLSNGTSAKWRQALPADKEPEFRFKAPLNAGIYRINFKATFLFYGDLPGGSIYGESNSVNSTFSVLRADAVDACWGDTHEHLDGVIDVRDTIVAGEMCKLWSGNTSYSVDGGDIDSLSAKRLYKFNAEGGLREVEEIAEFELKRKSTYKEFEDGTSGMVYDSLYNQKVYPHLMGQLSIQGYEPNGEAVLEGDRQNDFPVSKWGTYNTIEEQAALVNAFWNGDLSTYIQEWFYDDITRCVVNVWCEDNKLVFRRLYTPF